MYLVFTQFLDRASKTLGISYEESYTGIFCYVNEVTFGELHLWMGADG